MDERLKQWQDAKDTREAAEKWNNLHGPRYRNDDFEISIAHCTAPKLTRAGQQNCGGQTNYWETKPEFNLAILEYLIFHWKEIYPHVLEILKKKEQLALENCQSYIDEIQNIINYSKKEGNK